MLFPWLKRKSPQKQAAAILYQAARAQSRDPVFYAAWGVADTMDGRFDMLSLHVALMMARLAQFGAEGRRLSQALFDQMFRDIDQTLRETGVGDLGVPKHMAKMMKAFNGRAHAYHTALVKRDVSALNVAIARNIYRLENIPAQGAAMADYAFALKETLDRYGLDDFRRAAIDYPSPLGEVEKGRAAHA